MSDPASGGVHLTKSYYKDFLPTDLQWEVGKIDDDFTLYDLFRLVYHANNLIPDMSATMGMFSFDKFWDQIQLDRDPDDINDIDYLELYWSPSYDTRVVKKTGKQTDQQGRCSIMDNDNNYWDDPKICEMPNLMSFHGIGQGCPSRELDYHECGDDCPIDGGYAIEFTQVNNLAHLPICVSPNVDFFPPFVESNRDFHRTGFKLSIKPTLWCFITSVFWELTFVGSTPGAVADGIEKIQNDISEIKEHMKRTDENEEDDSNPDIC